MELIAAEFTETGNVTSVLEKYPVDGPAVVQLFGKLYGYMNFWFDHPIQRPPWTGCQVAEKKNTQAVLLRIAAIRDSTTLNNIFGGVINYFFDAEFSSSNLNSVYTRTTYSFGGPQKFGNPPYSNADDRKEEQEDNFVDWFWNTAFLQDTYDEENAELWQHLRPTGLLEPLLEKILISLLVSDGLRAVAPLLFVFLVVWFQTRSLFIAIVTIVECVLSFTGAILFMVRSSLPTPPHPSPHTTPLLHQPPHPTLLIPPHPAPPQPHPTQSPGAHRHQVDGLRTVPGYIHRSCDRG